MYQQTSKLASFLQINWPFLVLENLPLIQFHDSHNQLCTLQYNNNRFSMLSTGRSSFFYLSILEASFIGTLQPKEFCYHTRF